MQQNRLDSLPPGLLAELAERGELRAFARNEQLISEGGSSDFLFILVAGEVKVFTQDEKGRELVYNVLQAGELFGELFLDGDVRSASVRAITDVRCILVDRALAQGLIRSYPDFAEFLILNLIERLRHATELCKRLGLSDVFARTIAVLEQNAVMENGMCMVPTSLTQQEIADRVGATREMINHVIGDLIRSDFLVRDGGRRLIIAKSLPHR